MEEERNLNDKSKDYNELRDFEVDEIGKRKLEMIADNKKIKSNFAEYLKARDIRQQIHEMNNIDAIENKSESEAPTIEKKGGFRRFLERIGHTLG